MPEQTRTQCARLFGAKSKAAQALELTEAQWRSLLRKQLAEVMRYCVANVESDQIHQLMIQGCFGAADQALKDDTFWPRYVEAITRLVFILMGDYPNHRRRQGSGIKADHYSLRRCRTLNYTQRAEQKVWLLIWAQDVGVREFNVRVATALTEYYVVRKSKASKRGFLNWFRANYPVEYASIF